MREDIAALSDFDLGLRYAQQRHYEKQGTERWLAVENEAAGEHQVAVLLSETPDADVYLRRAMQPAMQDVAWTMIVRNADPAHAPWPETAEMYAAEWRRRAAQRTAFAAAYAMTDGVPQAIRVLETYEPDTVLAKRDGEPLWHSFGGPAVQVTVGAVLHAYRTLAARMRPNG